MTDLAFQEGRYYVGGNKGVHETFIRRIDAIVERGDISWSDYSLNDGRSIGADQCSERAFRIWTIREATEAEIAKCYKDPNRPLSTAMLTISNAAQYLKMGESQAIADLIMGLDN